MSFGNVWAANKNGALGIFSALWCLCPILNTSYEIIVEDFFDIESSKVLFIPNSVYASYNVADYVCTIFLSILEWHKNMTIDFGSRSGSIHEHGDRMGFFLKIRQQLVP